MEFYLETNGSCDICDQERAVACMDQVSVFGEGIFICYDCLMKALSLFSVGDTPS